MEKRNLKDLKDRYLIDDIRLNNDNESLNELHERYKNMYYKQAHRFDNFFKINNIRLSDALNESHYVIYDSARTFDETKGIKYITWLGSKTKFYFLNNSILLIIPFQEKFHQQLHNLRVIIFLQIHLVM